MKLLPLFSSAVVLVAGLAIAEASRAAGDAGRTPPAPAPATMYSTQDTLQSDEDGHWPVTLRIVNPSEYGLYGDSLFLLVESRDADGRPVPSKPRPLMLTAAAMSITGGDSLSFDMALPAEADQALLVFRFFAHDHEGHVVSLADTVHASGSVLSTLCPSEIIRVRGRDVEIVRVASRSGAAPSPGILVLPAEGSGARSMLVTAVRVARLGYALVLVSPTGAGRSTGPDDFAGPMSIAAAAAALDTLARMPGVDAGRLAVWGTSNGGTLGLLLAADRPQLRAVVAQSAGYDTWATYRFADPERRRVILAQAGRDSAGWRARSPLARSASLKAAVFVLHGETDALLPASQAHALVERLGRRAVPAESHFFPRAAHVLPPFEAYREAMRFLDKSLGVSR